MIWGSGPVRRPAHRRRSAIGVAALLAAALILLAVPAFAAAVGFEVNGNTDGENRAECESPSGADECTLRGAIEAANASPGFSLIEFPAALFTGRVGIDEIGPGASPLPAITQPLLMFGHRCEYPVLGYSAPCVEVKGRIGQPVLKVESNEVTIEGVAFGGAASGIQVAGSADKFIARSDWFGLRLDASADPLETAGIIVGTASDEATIGGTEKSERNVFANADTGVELKGASRAKILGNYIGVQPDGTGAAGLETGVRIEDFAAPAENDEIGGTLGATEVATEECVGPCNAIAATGGGQAIDLAGPASDPQPAAHGPTFIRGNFIGLEPDGTGTVGESTYGVLAAPSEPGCANGPSDVTVGGAASGAGNFIAGGTFGIVAESAENFSAIGNTIGATPDGTATLSPGASAISICAESVTEPATVAGNRMVLAPGTIGVESFYGHARITGNFVYGGYIGVLATEEDEGAGDLIGFNQLTAQDLMGIEISNDSNVVIGNRISESGRSGIVINTDANHNRIGGDGPGEANLIAKVHGPEPEDGAITIFGRESGRNEIAANSGSLNPGAFIKLLPHGGQERPNGGIQPPVFGAAYQSKASGTAEPNATVRIFAKQTPEPGELGGLLAVVKADAGGAWTATFATQPVGALITATQTKEAGTPQAGTSVLGTPAAVSVEPAKPDGGATQPPSVSPPPPPPPKKAPKVKITSGPKKNGTAPTAKFKFKAEPAAGAKFECKLDGSKWAKCRSPKAYKKLKLGKHTFRVRATANGLTGPATKFEFTVKA